METRRLGDRETMRQGDMETRKLGDRETRRLGDREAAGEESEGVRGQQGVPPNFLNAGNSRHFFCCATRQQVIPDTTSNFHLLPLRQ